MIYEVEVSEQADRDLREIFEYIAEIRQNRRKSARQWLLVGWAFGEMILQNSKSKSPPTCRQCKI